METTTRQYGSLEQRFEGQATHAEQDLPCLIRLPLISSILYRSSGNTRLRDASAFYVNGNIGSLEGRLIDLEHRIFTLSASVKGITDDLGLQKHRIAKLDTRLCEWQLHVEERILEKLDNVNKVQQQIGSAVKLSNAANFDTHKKFDRRMCLIERCIEHEKYLTQGHLNLRLNQLATAPSTAGVVKASSEQEEMLKSLEASVFKMVQATIEQGLANVCERVDHFVALFQDVQTRIEVEKERARSIRTLLETTEEHARTTRSEVLELDSRSKEQQDLAQEALRRGRAHGEQLDILNRRLQRQEPWDVAIR